MDMLKRKTSSMDIELQPTSSGDAVPEEPIDNEPLYSCIPSIDHEIDFSSMNQKIKNLNNYQILKVENSPSMSEVLDSIPSLVKSFLIPFNSSLCIHYRIKGRISELTELQFFNFNKNFHGYQGSFLIVFESIADNTAWIYWRLKDTKQIFCYNFTENIANVGAFVRDFLFNALKEGRTGINTSLHFHKNLLKVPVVIEMFSDSRRYNLLFLASEAGHTELVKFLMKKLNLKDAVKGVAAIDLAYEKKHFDIVLMFLKNNSRFPNNFVITSDMNIPTNLKEFLTTIDELHEAIKNGDSMKTDQIIRENMGMNFFYNQNNVSAVSVAISSKAFDVYENLIKRNVFMDQNESFDDLLNELTKKERNKLAKIHSKNSKLLTEPHLLVLMANTNVGFDDDKREMRLSLVHDALQKLNKNEVCKLLLQIVAATRNFEIHFDFNRDDVQFIDPKSEAYTNGLFYLSGKIYIAAKNLLNPERANEVLGVIAHELCHFVMFKIFGNNAKPYTKKDSVRKDEFAAVISKCEELKNLEQIVNWVFELYSEDQFAAELIVRWPHILGHYIDNPQRVQELEETFKDLVDYFNEKVLPVMKRKLPEIEKEVNQKREEKIAKPSTVFRIYWKWILFFLSIIGLSVLILLLHPCIFKYCGTHPSIFCENDGFNAVCGCKGNLSYVNEDCHICANDTNCPVKEVCWNLKCYDQCENSKCTDYKAKCIIDDLKTRCVCADNLKWIIDKGCFRCIHNDDCKSGETCMNFKCLIQTPKEIKEVRQLDLIVPSSGRIGEIIKVEAVVVNVDGNKQIDGTLFLTANLNFEFIEMSSNGTSVINLSDNRQGKHVTVQKGLNETVSFYVRAFTVGNLDLTLEVIGKGFIDNKPVEKAFLIKPNEVHIVAAKPGEWPWLVSLFGKQDNQFFCGSTLINEKTLVTAAHCVYGTSASKIKAYLGKFNLSIEDEENSVMRLISKKKVHKDYNHGRESQKYLADIAILIMERPVLFTDYIQPICLPSGNEKVFDINGTVVGYGKSGSSSPPSDVPYLANMTSISSVQKCLLSHEKSTKIVSPKSFCAYRRDGSPCKGDSGGGFYTSLNSKWTLLGIVSYALNDQCDPNGFVTFVNVPLFVEWINENAEKIVTVGGEIKVERKCEPYIPCKDYLKFIINSSEVPNSPNYKLKSSLNNEVNWFDFKGQKSMKYLPLNTFEVFPNIKVMDGITSGIVKIFKSNFKNCKKLKRIWLLGNEIEVIEAGSFDDATELEGLFLNGNKISSLDPKLFHKTKKLKTLYLGNNQLTSLSVDAFINLTELEILSLGENKISSLDSKLFHKMKKLKELNLYDNDLTSLSANAFIYLTELEDLGLGKNKISSLDPKLFHSMKKLKKLNLKGNKLTSLSPDAFIYLTELELIFLYDNPVSSSINETLYFHMNKKLKGIYINKSP